MNNTEVIQNLSQGLCSGSEEERYNILLELTELDSIETVPSLVTAVGDESSRIREGALQALGSFDPETIFPEFEGMIRDDDNASRRNAAMEAFPLYGRVGAEYVLNMLKDKNEEVRLFSAQILGEIADSVSVEALIDALTDDDENVRHAAAESLGKIGDARAVEPLRESLKSGDFWASYAAVNALGCIGDPSAVEALLPLLDDEMLRQGVVDALGNIGNPEAIDALVSLLSGNMSGLRNDVIAALVKIQSRMESYEIPQSVRDNFREKGLVHEILQTLSQSDIEVKKNSIIALGWLKAESAVDELLTLINDYELEEYVTGAIVSIGESAIPALIKKLEEEDGERKLSLIRSIGWIGGEEADRCLIPLLEHKNTDVCCQTILVLSSSLDKPEVRSALLTHLGTENPEIRATLVDVFSKDSSPELTEALLEKIKSKNRDEQMASIKILAGRRAKEAIVPFVGLLDSPYSEIRAEVFSALGLLGLEKVKSHKLLEGLKDNCPAVRKAAVKCVCSHSDGNIKSSIVGMLYDSDSTVRIEAIKAMGIMRQSGFALDLAKLYQCADKLEKIAIIDAMGNMDGSESVNYLIEILKDSNSDLKGAAIDALGKLKAGRAVSAIVVTLDDLEWSVKCSAIEALANIGDERAYKYLCNKLKDNEEIVRKKAIMALGELGVNDAVEHILPLIHDDHLQGVTIRALERLGIPDYEHFAIFFERCNTPVKKILVDLIGKIRCSQSLDFLLSVLEKDFFSVRVRAAKALGEIGDEKAIMPLTKILKDDPSEEVQLEAARALRKLNR